MRADLGIVDRLDPCVNEVNEINYVPLGSLAAIMSVRLSAFTGIRSEERNAG